MSYSEEGPIIVNKAAYNDPAVKHVLITGAAGQIGYLACFRVANGDLLGNNTKVFLHLLEIPQAVERLKGTVMELVDAAFEPLAGLIATTDLKEACSDIDYAFLIASVPRAPGGDRASMLIPNARIFRGQGEALDLYAKEDVKICVIGNPCNTNCLVGMTSCKRLGPKNWTALSRLDHNRTYNQVARKLEITTCDLRRIVVWGNHANTMYPDVEHCEYHDENGWHNVSEKLDTDFVQNELCDVVSDRAWAVARARQNTSAGSAFHAALNHMRDWIYGTPEGNYSSMCVLSEPGNSYGVHPGLIFSFPCICKDGEYKIVEGLELSEFSKLKLLKTTADLISEKYIAFNSCQLEF